jgi:ABC-2 type transport system ATP-binding protein
LSDAETLCDRVALLRGGRLVAVGRLNDILNIDVTEMEVLVAGIPTSALEALPLGSEKRRAMGERWSLHVPEAQLGTVVSALEKAGGRILSVLPVRQSLEEYFFKEMGAPTEWDLVD